MIAFLQKIIPFLFCLIVCAVMQLGARTAYADSNNITDMNHYIQKFEFYAPTTTYTLTPLQIKRFKAMMPYALAATAAFDISFKKDVEPELLIWWTYSEGIDAQVNYSNCANEPADYFHAITNCDRPDFWQLGYGNQFGNIWILKSAFHDMHGDPTDANLVQKVGQAVLDSDKAANTSPTCGGFSCTFPAMTIDQIMSDVHNSCNKVDANTNKCISGDDKETENNWWASVLSRDPGINSYMDANALQVSLFNRKAAWGWGDWYRTGWQTKSNQLATILKFWNDLGGCNGPVTCPQPSAPPPPCIVDKTGKCDQVNTGIGTIHVDASTIIGDILGIILGISGGIATLLIIFSGYRILFSQGDPEKLKEARAMLTAAVIGLLFIIFSLVLLRVIGVDILHLPGLNA